MSARLHRQLAAAIAIGDRAAELIIRSRIRPMRCATFECERRARPDGPLCQGCFERLVWGDVQRPERRDAPPRWAP